MELDYKAFQEHPEYAKEISHTRHCTFWRRFVVPAVRRKDRNKCLLCGEDNPRDIHHTKYVNAGLFDLASLCRKCHRLLHTKNIGVDKLQNILEKQFKNTKLCEREIQDRMKMVAKGE